MRYKCETCGKEFSHIANRISTTQKTRPDGVIETVTFEVPSCPFCEEKSFNEAPEEKTEPKMLDMQDVPVENVKALLEKGYVVRSDYAKAVRMVLYEKIKQPTMEAKP
jgi:hypothetical protein